MSSQLSTWSILTTAMALKEKCTMHYCFLYLTCQTHNSGSRDVAEGYFLCYERFF